MNFRQFLRAGWKELTAQNKAELTSPMEENFNFKVELDSIQSVKQYDTLEDND